MELQKQIDLIRSGAVELITEKELEAKLTKALKEKRPLRIKYGADPSAPDLHLGHTVPLRKLRQFQDLGHLVVFIIGDFTARVGDPSGRTETRKMLTREEVRKNSATYQEQVFKILDRNRTEIHFNSDWLEKIDAGQFLELTSKYTVARLLERDDFEKRYRAGQPIALVEFLYPLLQGYDSVMVRSDLEIGGTDQKFNLLVGRELQREWGQDPQVVLTLPLLAGTDGVKKMSKSFNNYISINDTPKEMFGKIMSIPDSTIAPYFMYASGATVEEYKPILKELDSQAINPRDVKADLAERIVRLYYTKPDGTIARQEFDRVFKDKGLPEEIETVKLKEKQIDLVSLLKETGLVPSKMEARRLISQGGVKIDSKKIEDEHWVVHLEKPVLVQCGKRKFIRVKQG